MRRVVSSGPTCQKWIKTWMHILLSSEWSKKKLCDEIKNKDHEHKINSAEIVNYVFSENQVSSKTKSIT